MSVLTSLARAEAVRAGRAQPIATVRHVHLHERPLVLIPLVLAGEANAPLAAMVGDRCDAPRLLIVPQPRNRDQRFAFAESLASVVVSYVDSFVTRVEAVAADRGREIRVRYADAPQILVPNAAGVGFVRLFGRSTRFRRSYGEAAVAPAVPLLGRWLTFFAERAEHPGSCLLLTATGALAMHWASGQSPVEDQNLAALLGWIAPPSGMTGPRAAAAAEDPLTWPPAGPATDPGFDNEILSPLIEAGDVPALEKALATQLEPTWALMWRAVDLLRDLPVGDRVAGRWDADKDAYTAQVEHHSAGGPPQPRRDSAVAAAQRLNRLERAAASYAAQRAFDDPLVFAEYRLAGEAFAGVVTGAEPERTEGAGRSRKLRPHITVATADPVRLPAGAQVVGVGRPGQKATVVAASEGTVLLELSGGMGRGKVPAPGSVPEVGERVRYSSIVDGYQPTAVFPDRQDTPWTHGGPPAQYEPSDSDAREAWS
ncbi:hypothetical protein GCM10023322_10520 [Rugosimonospora acidiphila]|uniref:Uncharacterized protein n=1 Tax=Rugosimonospora acidiphila TaxID=556531 RepID=A0ABP9RLN8_9ACTN